MAKKKVFTVEIKPSYLCNQDCVMCPYHEMDSAHTMTWQEVQSNLEFVHQNVAFGRFDLSGGEPTIYKHFFDILDWFKENLPRTVVYIHTNGVKFADESFVKRMSGYNVTCYVSFHNPDEETSRLITRRKNHYQLLLAGLENLKKYRIPTEATVVLTKLNQDRLNEINTALSRFPIQYLSYRLPHPIKKEDMEIYKPDICGLMEKVKASQKSLKIPGRVNMDSFPYCFSDREKLAHKRAAHIIVLIDKLHQFDNADVVINYESAISEGKHYSGLVKETQCSKCTFDKCCQGISREYLLDMHKKGLSIKPVEIVMEKRKVFTVEIKPSYLCNQDCIMCPYHEKTPSMDMTWDEIKESLEYARDNFEFDRFDLSGGEPTICKHFFDILDWLKENLPKTVVYIHTNGVMFSNEELAKKLANYNVVCYVSFHNPDEKTSEILSQRKNHHKLLLLGLENLKKYDIKTEATVVLTKLNQDRLDEINKELSKFPIRYLAYRLPKLIKKEFVKIYKPDIVGLVEKVNNSQKSLKIPGQARIVHFPHCFFGLEKLSQKGVEFIIVFIDKKHQKEKCNVGTDFETAISEKKYYGEFSKQKQCEKCIFYDKCRGISKEYLVDMKNKKIQLNPVEVDLDILIRENMK